MRLKVSIGADRFHQTTAYVNDPTRPIEIDSELFVGRVCVLVDSFTGVTPDGSEPVRESSYFKGRSRKFAILIEGRFKKREGVPSYSGEEIQFGSDFDFLPASFPHGPFNAGMRVAKYVDPATFFNPDSARPFIMSPFLACMNTLCAYPSPEALSRALLLAHHDLEHPHLEGEEADDGRGMVPLEDIHDKGKREKRPYWRFVGLVGNPAVDAFAEEHRHLFSSSLVHSLSSNSDSPPLSPSTPIIGNDDSSTPTSTFPPSSHFTSSDPPPEASEPFESAPLWGAAILSSSERDGETDSGRNTPTAIHPHPHSHAHQHPQKEKEKKKKATSRFSLANWVGGKESTTAEEEELHSGDLVMGDKLKFVGRKLGKEQAEVDGEGEGEAKADEKGWIENRTVEKQLGPWRFGEEGVDALEDTTFVFLDPAHSRSVAQRRKHFCADGGKYRKEFTYDPDVVYTASFFSSFCDLNSFDLKMGPLNINIAHYFTDQPIRYTLRSTRMVPKVDGTEGEEEECFATISFMLVDE